jgi:hypothetical protein
VETIIAIDPGQSNGYAIYRNAVPVEYGTLMWEAEFLDWLNEQNPEVFVYESYFINIKIFNHAWDRGIALQAIGAIKAQARRVGSVIVAQQPAVKPVAYGQMNAKYVKGKKDMHHMDALAHGHHFLIKSGLKKLGS